MRRRPDDRSLDRLTPVEQAWARQRRRRWLLVVLLVAAALYWLVFVNDYVVAHDDPDEHFLHGSIGSEAASGLPYWVFRALPVLYDDHLDGQGWRHFGFLYAEPDDDLPIGFSRRIASGVERVWLNCAVCHVGTYRLERHAAPTLVLGAPANNLRLQEFILFLLQVGRDPGFDGERVVRAIESDAVGGDLTALERIVYRRLVVPAVRSALLGLNDDLAFIERQHGWGPGRVDTFNPYKSLQLGFPMGPEAIDEIALNGAADYPSIWQQRPREGMNLHWDGNNDSVAERNLSAALGAGVTPRTVDREAIGRVADWAWELPPPRFPAPETIDRELAAEGRDLYARYCAACHGMAKEDEATGALAYDYDRNRYPRLGEVERLELIGTDRGRWASYTEPFAAAQNMLYAGYDWRFRRFHKTAGYANHPLDGIWARSPYLHNGSVPTLRDLLAPAERRPEVFWRGSDLFDLDRVGYRSDRDAAPPEKLFRYDTTLPGNGNQGHDGPRYGTHLTGAEKDAIVEYMKLL
ncbi:MAG: cytochrome c [Pseudomonadota bacterium]